MFLSGRPLLDTRSDASLFLDPQQLVEQLSAAGHAGLNALVTGPRGIGKTSLLRQVLLHRRTSSPGRTALVSAGTASTVSELLTLVHRALLDGLPGGIAQQARASSDLGVATHRPSAIDLVEALAAAEIPPESMVLVDNLRPDLAHAAFGQLRDELWQLPLVWVVTCSDHDAPGFLRPPADAFFDTVLRIEPLETAAMRDLLRRRTTPHELDDESLSTVVDLAGGNPRAALDLARQLSSSQLSAHGFRVLLSRRAATLAGLGRPAEMLFADLQASGGASASDEALLARLGWTRARAAQVLDQLAEAGLVEATDVRNGPGRPRRVYRPVSAVPR